MGAEPKNSPQRTCISCRSTGDKDRFLRFVLSPERLVTPDIEYKLPGRGAYTCISATCLREAVKKRQFGRAFKDSALSVDADYLDSILRKQMNGRIEGYIALASKAGEAVSGAESIERTMRGASKPSLLLIALDASKPVAEKLESLAKRSDLPFYRVLDKEQFGCLLGKSSDRSAVLIMSAGFGKSLVREIERYRNYLQEESGR